MKVKKTAKSTLKKKKAKKSEEPMVKVLNLNVNPENPRNGFFELDWNDEFVNMLSQSGYQGASEEEIVDSLKKYVDTKGQRRLARILAAERLMGESHG